MAQSDPSAVATAAKRVQNSYVTRVVAFALECNWQKDTTDWLSGTWTDETRFVKQLSGHMQLFDFVQSYTSHGAIPPWTMKVTLQNASGRYSPQRTDGALYAQIQGYRIYQVPIRAWVGFYNKPGTNPASTTLTSGGGINASVTTFTTGAALNVGEIVRMGTEDILVRRASGTTVQDCIRGCGRTTAASHNNGDTIARVGGQTKQFCGVISAPTDGADFNAGWDCVDRFGLNIQEMESSVAFANVYPEALIADFLALIASVNGTEPLPPAQQQFEYGTFPVGVGYLDRESIIREAQKVAAGDGGILFCNKDGKPTFWGAAHWVGKSSVYTFDHPNVDSFKAKPSKDLFSTVIQEYAPRSQGVVTQVFKLNEVWTLPAATTAAYAPAQTLNGNINASQTAITVSGTVIANGDVIRYDSESCLVSSGGGTNNLVVVRGYANTTAASHTSGAAITKVTPSTYATTVRYDHGCTVIYVPVGGAPPQYDLHHPKQDTRDYAAHNGGGDDITASVTIQSFLAYAQMAQLTLNNYNVSYGAFVTRFNVQGVPILGMPTKQVEVNRVPSPAVSGRMKTLGGDLRNWNSQSEAQVTAKTNMLADRWSVLRGEYEATVRGFSLLEPGDLVVFNESVTLSAPVTAIVFAIDWTLGNIDQGKATFDQTLICEDFANWYPSSSYALVGTTTLGTGVMFY